MKTKLSTSRLTPLVEQLVSTWLGTVIRTDLNPIETYLEMVSHPIIGAGADLRILLGVSMLEDYAHPDTKKEEEVRKSIVNSRGSWLNTLSSVLTYIPFGYSFSEVVHPIVKRKATLGEINLVDPRHYVFEGGYGEITRVRYNGRQTLYIPYENGIHLVNQPYFALGGDPYGFALCRRAHPYWELYKIVMACIAIASKRQATPIPYGKTDTSKTTVDFDGEGNPILDPQTGEPMEFNQGWVMQKKLEELENTSAVVIDLMDELDTLNQQTDGQFFKEILSFLEGILLLCFLVPRTVTGTGATASGDSNLNEGHRETLRLVTRAQMEIVSEVLVDKAIKPMLMFNYGELDDYGTFPIKQEDSLDTVKLLDVISNVVAKGGFSDNDLEVVNRMRHLAGIQPISELELAKQQSDKIAKQPVATPKSDDRDDSVDDEDETDTDRNDGNNANSKKSLLDFDTPFFLPE